MNSRMNFTSVRAYAEIYANIARTRREQSPSAKEAGVLDERFDADWVLELSAVDLSVGVLGFVRGIVGAHPLRGADVIQLASALWLRDAARLGASPAKYDRELEFSASDRQLCITARNFGLKVFNPQTAK